MAKKVKVLFAWSSGMSLLKGKSKSAISSNISKLAGWEPPVAYPDDGKMYRWDEATVNWKVAES